jgi:predicted MFS family arabinose efflux permease
MHGPRHAAIRFIVVLGIVSLFADMTYEGARSILGPFLQNLGAGAADVGIVAGFGEMVAAGLRFFSGRLADRSRAYWTLTFLGYALSVLTVPLLAFALGWPMAAALIIAERTGKSLRGPSRDVLLSQATGRVGHGWGFGLHTALDQTGAVLGPLLVAGVMASHHHYAPALLWLGVPALATLVCLAIARSVDPYPTAAAPAPVSAPRRLPRVFWIYAAAAGLLACGFIDFPLLAFHFQNAGIVRSTTIPLLYAAAMAVNGLSALVFGKLFDRFGVFVLAAGTLFSIAALPLGFAGGSGLAAASVLFWGLGMGAQDACLRSGIAHVVSMNSRGRAFGAFSAVYGILWFAGSAAMGLLYNHSQIALVVFGMAAQFAAALIFLWLGRAGLLESNRS